MLRLRRLYERTRLEPALVVAPGWSLMYVYLGILLAGLLGGFTGGWQVQNWRHGAEQHAQDMAQQARRETFEAAQKGTAEAIAALKPVNTTIVQKTQKEIRENTRYIDCRVTPDGLRLANEAITGRPEPSGDRSVSGAKPAQ